ncbi:MAG: sugar phosphate nucleotidyltransferase [Acidimicrobiia bacterium]
MRAVVLVGGFGTRLRPLTYHTPKPMLPVGHLPILEWVVRHLGRHGVDEVVLSLGFKPEPFMEAYPDAMCAGVRLSYAVEPEPLDTAGAIKFAAEFAGIDDTFVVVNGDVLSDVDVSAMVAFHRAHNAEGTIHLIGVEDPSAFGVVPTDDDGRVVAFIEKPAPGTAPTNQINGGTYVLEPSVLARIPSGRKVSIERETFPAMVAGGTLYALPLDCYWLDTGRPDQYLQANLDVLDGLRAHDDAVAAHAPGAVVAGAVRHSIVGVGAVVGPEATVIDSVLLPGAQVSAGAHVVESVLGPGSKVGEGAILTRCVLGAEAQVEPGEILVDVRRPEPA